MSKRSGPTTARVLNIGTAANPVAPNVTAKVTFIDTGATDRTWDPEWLSRGLLSMGFTTMYGSVVTPYEALSQPAVAGNTDLVVPTPTGWNVGDNLVLGGTTPTANQDEQLTVLGITALGNGLSDVKVSALKYSHLAPNPELERLPHRHHAERGVQFGEHRRQTGAGTSCSWTCRPSTSITSPSTTSAAPTRASRSTTRCWTPTGTRARHRHQPARRYSSTSTSSAPMPPTANRPSPGAASSAARAGVTTTTAATSISRTTPPTTSTASAFVAERGDEIGTYNGNLAIRGTGDGTGLGHMNSRRDNLDFGHDGEGFWFQGTNTTVTNNIAIGMPEAGFVYYPLNGMQFDHQNEIDISVANLTPDARSAFLGQRHFSAGLGSGRTRVRQQHYLRSSETDSKRSTITRQTPTCSRTRRPGM